MGTFFLGALSAGLFLLFISWLSGRRAARAMVGVRLPPFPVTGARLDDRYAEELARRVAAQLPPGRNCWGSVWSEAGTQLFCASRGSNGGEITLGEVGPRLPLASITKLFTAHAVVRELEAIDPRALLWPIAELLPAAQVQPWMQEISCADLLTHTAGLPRLPPGFAIVDGHDPYRGFDEQLLMASITSDFRRGARRYCYSNFGYAVAGQVLAAVRGRSFEDIMSSLTASLGLRRTGFGADALGPPIRADAERWSFDAMRPAGGLHGDSADLATYLGAALTDPPMASLLRPWRGTSDARTFVGLGWHCNVADRMRIWWHNGAAGSFSSAVALSRDAHAGLALLSDHDKDLAPMLILEARRLAYHAVGAG